MSCHNRSDGRSGRLTGEAKFAQFCEHPRTTPVVLFGEADDDRLDLSAGPWSSVSRHSLRPAPPVGPPPPIARCWLNQAKEGGGRALQRFAKAAEQAPFGRGEPDAIRVAFAEDVELGLQQLDGVGEVADAALPDQFADRDKVVMHSICCSNGLCRRTRGGGTFRTPRDGVGDASRSQTLKPTVGWVGNPVGG